MELNIIQNKIYQVRGVRVMLDFDLAELYQVETRVLNQAVKRNLKRFPSDFMFQLTAEEHKNLISQSVTSSWGGTRKLPNIYMAIAALSVKPADEPDKPSKKIGFNRVGGKRK